MRVQVKSTTRCVNGVFVGNISRAGRSRQWEASAYAAEDGDEMFVVTSANTYYGLSASHVAGRKVLSLTSGYRRFEVDLM